MTHVVFVVTCVLWGTSFILMKKASPAFGPAAIGCYRVLTGAAALGAILAATRRPWPVRRGDLPGLLLIALLGYAVPFAVQPWVIARSSSALMGMMIALVPLLTITVSIPLLRVHPTRRQLVGVLAGLACMAVLMADAWRQRTPTGVLLLALVVPLFYAVVNTYIKRRFTALPAMAMTAAALGLGGAMLLPVTLATERVNRGAAFPHALAALLVLGVICTGGGYFLFYLLVQAHGPLKAGMVSYVIPLVALAWGWLDGERITPGQVASLAGVLASVAVVQLERGRQIPKSVTTEAQGTQSERQSRKQEAKVE